MPEPRKSLACELEQLLELADHLHVTPFFEAGRHARAQMTFQERRLEGLERTLDGVRLLENVDAIFVCFNHLADAAEMTFDGRQAIEDLFLVGLHLRP